MRGPLPARLQDVPPLPPAAHDALARALTEAGVDAAGPAGAAIDGHLRLLLAWNSSLNLTSIRDPVDAVRLHVIDSLSAVPLLRALGAGSLLDLGSGGGYPGIPLAAALDLPALLVESIAKKARFLETAVTATGLESRVAVRPARAEVLAGDEGVHGRWDTVSVRAVGRLDELVELAMPLLRVGGSLVAWKRGELAVELADAGRAAEALGGGRPEVHTPAAPGVDVGALRGHVLVTVRKLSPTPVGFPRQPAARARRPW